VDLLYKKLYNIIIIISYHIVDLKRQNRLKVGTNKPKLKVKMQLVSDDDVGKRLLEQTRFELAAKGVSTANRKLYNNKIHKVLILSHSRLAIESLAKYVTMLRYNLFPNGVRSGENRRIDNRRINRRILRKAVPVRYK